VKSLRLLVTLVLIVAVILIAGSVLRIPGGLQPGAPVWTPISEQRMNHGRFQNVTVYSPHASPRGFVLLLSGNEGWTEGMAQIATHLAEQGVMVTGIDLGQFNAVLESDGGDCVYPDGDLENLSRFVQAYFRLPTYLSPILAGYGAGATLAYATLTQSPPNTFAGAVSFEFCPSYPLSKPLCEGSGLTFMPHTPGKGVDFLPSKLPKNAWTVVQNDTGACSAESVREFVAQVPGARFVTIPSTEPSIAAGNRDAASGSGTGTGAPQTPVWGPEYAAPVDALIALHPAAPLASVPESLSDLPIVTVPAVAGGAVSDEFAIVLSGDGGWAGLDKDVAAALAATGIPVIGLDSLRYFWSARTPAGLAHDLDRMTEYYLKALGKQRVLLIGYSQGADVLPFAVNHLSAATRAHVALTAVMGMSEHALFEFHMTSWVSDDNSGPATLPEVDKISGIPLLCIYGEDETDTLCPKLDPHKATIIKLKGGHHFDGDYANLAKIILAAAQPK
jgi:type IV secretory pathway VirJ component